MTLNYRLQYHTAVGWNTIQGGYSDYNQACRVAKAEAKSNRRCTRVYNADTNVVLVTFDPRGREVEEIEDYD